MMHISTETVNAFLIGVVCSFAPGVLLLVAWVTGHVSVQERRAESVRRAEQRQLSIAGRRKHQ